MRKLLIVVVAALVASFAFAACSSSAGSGTGLTGKTWQWTASTTKTPASQSVVPDPTKYTITFNTDGSYNAKADCNNASGQWKTSGNNGITLTAGPTTLVACGADSMIDIYLQGLANASTYAVSNGQLVLTTLTGDTMTFK